METPPPEPMTRRATRSALVEIPTRMGALTVNENLRTHGRFNNNVMTNLLLDMHPNLPASYMSPSPSPDELVIQQRGRRRLPVTWSPDVVTTPRLSPSKERTPVKHHSPNSKNTIVLRSTPRKRLLLLDPMEMSPSPEKRVAGSPNPKKSRLEKMMPPFSGPVDVALKALSNDQLVGIIQDLIMKHPQLEDEIKQNLPAPDLRPLIERLHDLKRNIFKSLPNSRLTSKTDSPAYNRAAIHLLAFKKCIQEQGRTLTSGQQWESVCDYVVDAWKQVAGTPLWDNPPHNNIRKHCFKFLASQCMAALKKAQLTQDKIELLHDKLQDYVKDSDDIQSCLKQLAAMKKRY